MEKFGIVICSRSNSERLPNKPFLKINGRFMIEYLIDRCVETGMPVYIAVPFKEFNLYKAKLKQRPDVTIVAGHPTDCLRRTIDVARAYKLDHIVRVTHDKVFIDHRQVEEFTRHYIDNDLQYLYSTNFIDGMSFEIFSTKTALIAGQYFKEVEHISFAIDAVASRKNNLQHFKRNHDWLIRKSPKTKLRLLVDYEADFDVMEDILSQICFLGTIDNVLGVVGEQMTENFLPFVSVYTCSFNDHEYLDEAIQSVLGQEFNDYEYILIDDGSSDPKVNGLMRKWQACDERVRAYRTDLNKGLASASNLAVQMAVGKYVIRLDADDTFFQTENLGNMYHEIKFRNLDALYPDNIAGHDIQRGDKHHHVGGTMFRKRALDYLKFTDGLRHFEGLDLYNRAVQKKLKLGYHNHIGFCYRQRPGSLSKTITPERKNIEQKLKNGITGGSLL